MKKLLIFGLIFMVSLGLFSSASAAGTIGFSQTNLSLNVGQNQTISAFAPSNQTINLTSITNSFVAYANVSGNQITVHGLGSGSTQMTFCTFDNSCGTIFVTVSGSGTGTTGQISFSQNNLNLNINQTSTINVFNTNNSSIFISSNSNPNAVSANLSGNTINLTGLNGGSATIAVCGNSVQCNNLFVTVNNNITGQISFSQNNLSLNVNDINNITVFNSTNNTLFISSNSNPNAVSANLSGNLLSIRGLNSGNSSVMVCANNTNICSVLTVNVSNNQGNLFFTNFSLPQPRVNQHYSHQLNVSGGIAPYNFSINSGFLPSGLTISNSGLIFGTPNNTSTANFSVRVTDNFGRSVISPNLTLTPTSGIVLGTLVYNNGTLINEFGTIYITYKNTKTGFANIQAFNGLGYKLRNVANISTSGLNSSNFIVSSSAAPHPWGSWVKNGSTIYYVHETGLIPIAAFDIFLNNGGSIQNVVEANAYDMTLPVQPVMTHNDFRLR